MNGTTDPFLRLLQFVGMNQWLTHDDTGRSFDEHFAKCDANAERYAAQESVRDQLCDCVAEHAPGSDPKQIVEVGNWVAPQHQRVAKVKMARAPSALRGRHSPSNFSPARRI